MNKHLSLKLRLILLLAIIIGTSLNVSAQLPAQVLKSIDGRTVRMDTLTNNGKPIIIDFFATWCKPCNRELNAIADVYEDWQKETGVKLVAISTDKAQNINKVAPLVSENGWPYELVLLDTNNDLMRDLSIQMIPYTLIIDRSGKIVYKHTGYIDGDEDELYQRVKELIK